MDVVDRILVMRDGRIVRVGFPAVVHEHPARSVVFGSRARVPGCPPAEGGLTFRILTTSA